jgi:hypothetical protein
MSMRRLAVSASASLVLVLAACSTVGFDGFVSEDRDDGDAGFGSDSPSGTGSDGGNNLVDDGGTESDSDLAGDAADPNLPPEFLPDGSTSFCNMPQGPTAFCDDFDTVDLSAHWLREGVFGRLTSHSAKSAPNTFFLNVPATTASGTFVSKIARSFEVPSRSMILGFDFKPELVNTGSSFFILAALEWPAGENKYSLRLVYSSGGIRLEESNLVPPPNNVDAYHPFFNLPEGKWSRITIDVVASGTTPGVQISVDGLPKGGRETLTPTVGIDERPTVILGAVFAGNPHSGWALRYDNVTVNLR